MLELNNVSITFQQGSANEKKALQSLSLTLNDGDFVSIIGSNGAGKSTLLNAISGSIAIDSGSITLNNKAIQNLPEHKRAKMIGRLFQDPLKGTAPAMTIEENLSLAYNRGAKDASFFKRYLKLGLTKQEKEYLKNQLAPLDLGLEDRFHSQVGLLSGGQRQALTLIMATINTPNLLLLDEHTAALDPQTSKKVMDITDQIIHKQNITTVMITHNIKHALAYGNRMLVMSEGKILLDIANQEKSKLTVEDVMNIYANQSNQDLSDAMLLD